MNISLVSSGNSFAAGQQVPELGQQKHGRHKASVSDVDLQGSNAAANGPSQTAKAGSRIDIRV